MSAPEGSIRIVAVKGSVRPGNYTAMALDLVADEFGKFPEVELHVVDPAELGLAPPGMGGDNARAEELRRLVEGATGVVLSTPEYHGTFSSVVKLVIENLDFPSVLAGKPIALLGVAAGQIGAIKSLEHLRSVCSHVGAIVLPGPVSVAGVQRAFDQDGGCLDDGVEARVRGLATGLLDYIHQTVCPRVALEAMVRDEA